MPRILDILFSSVQFLASTAHVAIAATTDLKALAPHVKRVVFQPDKYSWAMTRELFEEIVMLGPLREKCRALNDEKRSGGDPSVVGPTSGVQVWWDDTSMLQEGWRGFVDKQMDGKAPWSDAELNEGFESYMAQAHATRAMFDSGDVQRAWATALRQLPSVTSFTVAAKAFVPLDWQEKTTCKNWRERGCEVYDHDHGSDPRGHSDGKCQIVGAAVGEALFSAVVASLKAAGSTLTEFRIQHGSNGDFKWADDGQLDGLDLSHLQKLYFCPEDLGRDIRASPKKDVRKVEMRSARAVMALLRASRETLKDLQLFPDFRDWSCPWPPPHEVNAVEEPDEIIELPALEHLKTTAPIRLSAFAQFLLRARNLKRLELQSNHRRSGEWRELWRAIRHHPSRMQLEIGEMRCNHWTEWGTSHFTGEKSQSENTPDDTEGNVDYELEMYLSNRGTWGRSCRWWHEELGTDDEYTDSESGAAEGSDAGDWTNWSNWNNNNNSEEGSDGGDGSEGESGEDGGGDGSDASAMEE
jgi:hypothetical protein